MKMHNMKFVIGGAVGYGAMLAVIFKDLYFLVMPAAATMLFIIGFWAWERLSKRMAWIGFGWTGMALYCECPYCAFVTIRTEKEVSNPDRAVNCDGCQKTFIVKEGQIRKRDELKARAFPLAF